MGQLRLFLLATFVCWVATGCQTVYQSDWIPYGLSREDAKIQKVLEKGPYELGLARQPTKKELSLICLDMSLVEGQRRQLRLQVRKEIEYSPWREFLEIPLLFPLTLAFSPFHLLAWVFGAEGGKLALLNVWYFLNPAQNGLIWQGKEKVVWNRGEYISVHPKTKKPLRWRLQKKIPFRLIELKLAGKVLSIPSVQKEDFRKLWKVPLPKGQRWTEPVELQVEFELQRPVKRLRQKLEFVFDDTPEAPEGVSRELALERGKLFFEIASHHYRKGEFSEALRAYHQSIAYYRIAHTHLKGTLPPHSFYSQAYLFRALSRIKPFAPRLKNVAKIPRVVAWHALIDFQNFLQLSPTHPRAQDVQHYLSLLVRKIYRSKKKETGQ